MFLFLEMTFEDKLLGRLNFDKVRYLCTQRDFQ